MRAVKNRPGETALMPALYASNTANAMLNPAARVFGQDEMPIVDPQTDEQWTVYEHTGHVHHAITVPMAAAGLAGGLLDDDGWRNGSGLQG